jgi:hypothetical protein
VFSWQNSRCNGSLQLLALSFTHCAPTDMNRYSEMDHHRREGRESTQCLPLWVYTGPAAVGLHRTCRCGSTQDLPRKSCSTKSKDKNSLKIKQNTKATAERNGKVRSTGDEKK